MSVRRLPVSPAHPLTPPPPIEPNSVPHATTCVRSASRAGANDTLTCRLPPGVGADHDVVVKLGSDMVVLEKGLSYGAPYITKISGCDGNGHTYECPSAGGATLVIKVCFACAPSPLLCFSSSRPPRHVFSFLFSLGIATYRGVYDTQSSR